MNYLFVSGFEKRGHFGPDLNFEILISTEIIGNQLSFTTCFMFIADVTRKSLLKIEFGF